MKANEVRIGNLVYIPQYKENEKLLAIELGNRPILSKKDNTTCSFSGLCCLEPISLTEEWLFKFGFEWSIRNQAWHKLGFIFDLSERGVGGYYMHMVKKNNDIICPEIIHVHQLQNLYFALTGEELTFKSE